MNDIEHGREKLDHVTKCKYLFNETMNVKIRTNTWAGFRFSKHEILLRCIQAAETEDYLIIIRASHHSSHLIKDIKSRHTGPESTRVPASPASHTSLDIGGLSHLVSCKHLLPGSHLSFCFIENYKLYNL